MPELKESEFEKIPASIKFAKDFNNLFDILKEKRYLEGFLTEKEYEIADVDEIIEKIKEAKASLEIIKESEKDEGKIYNAILDKTEALVKDSNNLNCWHLR